MTYVIRMITATGRWYWNGNTPNQYDQWRDSLDAGQHYQLRHMAERKASLLGREIGRLWEFEELMVIEVSA